MALPAVCLIFFWYDKWLPSLQTNISGAHCPLRQLTKDFSINAFCLSSGLFTFHRQGSRIQSDGGKVCLRASADIVVDADNAAQRVLIVNPRTVMAFGKEEAEALSAPLSARTARSWSRLLKESASWQNLKSMDQEPGNNAQLSRTCSDENISRSAKAAMYSDFHDGNV